MSTHQVTTAHVPRESPANNRNARPIGACPQPGTLTRMLLAAAAAVGGFLTFLLTVNALRAGHLAGCASGSSCDQVLSSAASRWLGIPVAAIAMGCYGLILVLMVLSMTRWGRRQAAVVWTCLLAVGLSMVGAAVWFTFLQIVQLRSICPYCMAAHMVALICAALIFRAVYDVRIHLGFRRMGGAVAAAAAGLLVLVGVPRVSPTATFTVAPMAHAAPPDGGPADGHEPAAVSNRAGEINSGVTFDTGIGPLRRLHVPGAPQPIDPRRMPMLGSPDAEQLMVLFYDYTCNHCRQLHRQIRHALDRYRHRLGVVLVNFPLSSNCNAVIGEFVRDEYRYACAYAQLAAAVWLVEPARFEEFDTWAMAGVRPRPLDIAAQYVSDLIGEDRLAGALVDPRLKRHIDAGVRLGADLPSKMLPLLLMKGYYMVGAPDRADDLHAVIEEQLGIKPVVTDHPVPLLQPRPDSKPLMRSNGG